MEILSVILVLALCYSITILVHTLKFIGSHLVALTSPRAIEVLRKPAPHNPEPQEYRELKQEDAENPFLGNNWKEEYAAELHKD